MAFLQQRFVRHTNAYNAGQISTTFNPDNTVVLENGPAIFSYANATDTVAQIGAANYFAEVVYDLAVNDQILVVGSDATEFLQVATVDRDAGTVTTVSAFPTGVIGTANITNLAVTTAKLADGSVTAVKLAAGAVGSASLAATALQYVAVPITAAEFNGMYAAPKQLVAAAGANTMIVLDRVELLMTYNSAAYAAGGVAAVQYDSTINGGGVIASSTNAAANFQAAASTGFAFNQGAAVQPFTTTVNKGLYLSNLTAAFTSGNSAMVAHVWYKVIPTV
jgi:hypothetical protein